MSMEQVVTNLQQQLGAQQQALQQLQAVMDSQQASAAQRENALQAQLADLLNRLNRSTAEPERTEVEHHVPKKQREFIEARAFSKLTYFDSKAPSWNYWAFKFENLAAAVVSSSRETLDWAAHRKTQY